MAERRDDLAMDQDEEKKGKETVLEITDYHADVFRAMLEYLYLGST